MTEARESRTKTARQPKAEPIVVKPEPIWTGTQFNHKPTKGDFLAVTPRLLESVATLLAPRELADVELRIKVQPVGGNYTLLVAVAD